MPLTQPVHARSMVRAASSLFIVLCCAFTPRQALAQTNRAGEYQIKAAFLFNFGQFVTWAPDAFPTAAAPFVICVLGEDPFGSTLDEIVEGATLQGRPTRVERYRDVEEAGDCQILFVSNSELPRLDRILGALGERGILTVGEGEAFAASSGIIRFQVVDSRLRLEINAAAAESAGLTISSRLLSLADVVR